LLTTAKGEPVEAFLTPGSMADVTAYIAFQFDLPENSTIYADKAIRDYCWRLLRTHTPMKRKTYSTKYRPP